MVRGDQKLNRSIRGAQSWRNSRFDAEVKEAAGNQLALSIGQSFSGNERNKLFFNEQATHFADLSAVSGLDNVADSRVLALWDFDRDGWQDMAVANANTALLNIYRNEIAGAEGAAAEGGRFIAIRFRGGNQSAQPDQKLGCRDGYGTKVRVGAGDFKLIREFRCGEGMAGQNSSTMIVGIGDNRVAQSVTVQWLSGATQEIHDVPAGTLLTVYEDPATAPGQVAETREEYVVSGGINWDDNGTDDGTETPVVFQYESVPDTSSGDGSKAGIRLYTTMATWCAACKRHLPQIQQLRSRLSPEVLEMYGVPVDTSDDPAKLSEYVERYKPAYNILSSLTDEQRKHAEQLVTKTLSTDALPSTIVTSAQGEVLLVTAGLPTVSQIMMLADSE